MMAAGSLVAASGSPPRRARSRRSGSCLAAGAGGRRSWWWSTRWSFPGCRAGHHAVPKASAPRRMPRFSRRLLGEGLLWSLAGWVLLGLSQVAVVRAVSPGGGGAAALAAGRRRAWRWRRWRGSWWPSCRGAWGSAKGCLMTTLGPALGEDTAVIAALALAADLGRRRGRRGRRAGAAATGGRAPTPAVPAPARFRAGRDMISVVIPLYNEAESLETLHAELDRVFAGGSHGPVGVRVRRRRQPRRLVGGRAASWRRRPAGPGHPVPPQLRQGRRADGRVPGRGQGDDRLHARRRPPGRPRRDPPVPRQARTGASTSSAAGSDAARPLAQGLPEPRLQPDGQRPDRLPAARPQLRVQGVPRARCSARSGSTASCTGSCPCWRTPRGSGSARSR